MPAADESISLPKTTPDDWVYSTDSMPSTRFWSPFDPGFQQVLKTLDRYVGANTKVLEIGFAPGKILAWAAIRKKAMISGVDYSKSGVAAASKFMKSISVAADLRNENVFETTFTKNSFDVVYSVGVIEHFDHPVAILQSHLDMARTGGVVVMFMPNYGGFWGKIQKRLDPDNLAIHNVDMMSIEAMNGFMQNMDCEIVEIGYSGAFSTSILSLEKALPSRLANYVHKGLNAISTFLPLPIGRLSPQIVTIVRKT